MGDLSAWQKDTSSQTASKTKFESDPAAGASVLGTFARTTRADVQAEPQSSTIELKVDRAQ